jgi:hypothetical protein
MSKKNVASTMTTEFFNIPKVQASIRDFCNFNKNFLKNLEKIRKKSRRPKKMLRPLWSPFFYNLGVQASAHDFCNFNKFFEKSGKNSEKKADVQKKCCVHYGRYFFTSWSASQCA